MELIGVGVLGRFGCRGPSVGESSPRSAGILPPTGCEKWVVAAYDMSLLFVAEL